MLHKYLKSGTFIYYTHLFDKLSTSYISKNKHTKIIKLNYYRLGKCLDLDLIKFDRTTFLLNNRTFNHNIFLTKDVTKRSKCFYYVLILVNF